jgi:predicted ABC-type ATPase
MPIVYIIGGCNGAGKTTLAYTLLPEFLQCNEYVNADAIANGLSAFNQEAVAFDAGRIMLSRIKDLFREKSSFAFETTMASRTFIPLLKEALAAGYEVRLVYVWLMSPDLAVQRVLIRKQSGGHDIPEDVIRRRYVTGRNNFINLYMPLSEDWQIVDNSVNDPVIEAKCKHGQLTIYQDSAYNDIVREQL